METLVRAVTEDHAVALITFAGITAINTRVSVETILLPIRHNGSTQTRMLGAMTALDEPYWLGVQPVVEQRITGLRLIWPDDASHAEMARDVATTIQQDVTFASAGGPPQPIQSVVFGRRARRYAHLSVIDGGRH
jgi:hypothetical protein